MHNVSSLYCGFEAHTHTLVYFVAIKGLRWQTKTMAGNESAIKKHDAIISEIMLAWWIIYIAIHIYWTTTSVLSVM